MYLARSQGRQVSREGLIAGLPLHDGRLVPSLVMRAADRAGLESTLVECPLEALAEDALPVILLLEDEGACVLLARGAVNARIMDAGAIDETIGLDELRQRYIGTAVLARANYAFDERAPELGQLAAARA